MSASQTREPYLEPGPGPVAVPVAIPAFAIVEVRALSVVRDIMSLTKPRLSAEVMFTCAGGLWLSGVSLPASLWLLTLLATAGTVGAANAFNCFIEREIDRRMARTANRPLAAGRMDP